MSHIFLLHFLLHFLHLQQLQYTDNHDDHHWSSLGASTCNLRCLRSVRQTDGIRNCQAVSPWVHRKRPTRPRKCGVEPCPLLPWHRSLWLCCSTHEPGFERQDCDSHLVLKPHVRCPRHPESRIRVPVSPRYHSISCCPSKIISTMEVRSDCMPPSAWFRIGHYFSPHGNTALGYARAKAPDQRYHGIFLCQARNFFANGSTERYVTRNEVRHGLCARCRCCIIVSYVGPVTDLLFFLGPAPCVPGDCRCIKSARPISFGNQLRPFGNQLRPLAMRAGIHRTTFFLLHLSPPRTFYLAAALHNFNIKKK